MLTRNKSAADMSGSRVSRSKRKTGYANSSKDKKTLLSNDRLDPVVKNVSRNCCVSSSVPSPQISRTRKRKSETAAINKDKKLKFSEKKQMANIKAFCWICHKPCHTEVCACSRVYHSECLKKASKEFDGNICPECQLKSVDGTELNKPFPGGINVYLECAANWIIEKYKSEVFMSWPPNLSKNKIVPAIDIKTLMNKVQENAYKRTSEFYSDAKWIHHSTCILYGEKSKEATESKKLVKDVKEELIDMEACPECYYYLYCKLFDDSGSSDEDSDTSKNLNYEKSFVRLCNPPHDIVWAKVSGYSHWPAKCLKVVNGKAHVRFFGKHEKSDIPIDTIFHISEKHPVYENRNITDTESRTSLEYTYAKKELLRYIALYKKNIGEFKYFGFREFYNTEKDNFQTDKNLEQQKEINQSIHLELPTCTNSASDLCISRATSVAVEHPQINMPNNFSNDISISMTFSVDGCGSKENSGNSDTTSTNVESSTNILEQSLSESNLDVSASNFSSISTGASNEVQVKEELQDSVEKQPIASTTEPLNNASSQFMQILQNAINNPSESFDFRRNTHTSDLLASVLQNCIPPTSTDGTHSPDVLVSNTPVFKVEDNVCPTANVPSPNQIHEIEDSSTENVAECVANDSVQQCSDCEASSSNKEIAVIDLTNEENDIDSSSMALANILKENPEMCSLFTHAHQTLHTLLTRLCVETCKQQRSDSRRRCEAFNIKLNETERRFHEETEKLRDEIKCLQKSLASEKEKNTKS